MLQPVSAQPEAAGLSMMEGAGPSPVPPRKKFGIRFCHVLPVRPDREPGL